MQCLLIEFYVVTTQNNTTQQQQKTKRKKRKNNKIKQNKINKPSTNYCLNNSKKK